MNKWFPFVAKVLVSISFEKQSSFDGLPFRFFSLHILTEFWMCFSDWQFWFKKLLIFILKRFFRSIGLKRLWSGLKTRSFHFQLWNDWIQFGHRDFSMRKWWGWGKSGKTTRWTLFVFWKQKWKKAIYQSNFHTDLSKNRSATNPVHLLGESVECLTERSTIFDARFAVWPLGRNGEIGVIEGIDGGSQMGCVPKFAYEIASIKA